MLQNLKNFAARTEKGERKRKTEKLNSIIIKPSHFVATKEEKIRCAAIIRSEMLTKNSWSKKIDFCHENLSFLHLQFFYIYNFDDKNMKNFAALPNYGVKC